MILLTFYGILVGFFVDFFKKLFILLIVVPLVSPEDPKEGFRLFSSHNFSLKNDFL